MKKIVLVLVLLNIIGCVSGFPEIKKVGIVEGYIKDGVSGNDLGGTYVKISSDFSYTTDSNGFFPIVNRENEEDPYFIPKRDGNSYQLKRAGYYPKIGTNVFGYGQKNLIGYLTPKPSEDSSYLTITVEDINGLLEGATVLINGTFTISDKGISSIPEIEETSDKGVVTKEIPNCPINVYVYKEGYDPKYKTLNINGEKNISIRLNKNEEIKYGDVKGVVRGYNPYEKDVTQAESGENSIVKVNGQWVMVDGNGEYLIKGIPVGDKTLTAKMPGFYHTYTSEVEVLAGEITTHNIDMEPMKGQ